MLAWGLGGVMLTDLSAYVRALRKAGLRLALGILCKAWTVKRLSPHCLPGSKPLLGVLPIGSETPDWPCDQEEC